MQSGSSGVGREKRGAAALQNAGATSDAKEYLRMWRWLFRVSAVLVPCLLIWMLELGLRIAGFGHPTAFLLHKEIGGRRVLVENAWFGLRFFPPALARSPEPVLIPAQKPPGTFRIFLFGESAALGDPRPAYGAGRYLETLLRERFPGIDFEVVCVAMTAINSHAIVPIARECARYQGDLWIVYMGNNEFIGPFGANTVFGPRAPGAGFVHLYLALQQTRVGQAISVLARRLVRNDSPKSWTGLKMFQHHQLAPNDARKEPVYSNFAQNVAEILNVAKRARVPVIVSSVASNLKDCPPFGSLHDSKLSSQDLEKCEHLLVNGAVLSDQGRGSDAIRVYEEAAKLSPGFAELHFRLGQCFQGLTNFDAAARSFRKARDLDALPIRADSRLNEILAKAVEPEPKNIVTFLDAEELLSQSGKSGIPGEEDFLEHVHFNSEGNYRLARAFAEKTKDFLPARVVQSSNATWAEPERCDQLLGLTDWNRVTIKEEILRRMSEPPFTRQFDHTNRVRGLTSQLNSLKHQLQPQAQARARVVYDYSIKRRPLDPWLHHNCAEFLVSVGELSQAAEQMQIVRDLFPHHHAAYFQLGRILARQGQYAAARASLQEALALRPDVAEVHIELGHVWFREGKFEEAYNEYSQAKLLRPDDAKVFLLIAKALEQQGKRSEAIQSLREATRHQPDYWEAHDLLGIELAMASNFADAQTAFSAVVRLNPDYAEGHLNLGIALARQERFTEAIDELQAALRLEPANAKAKELIGLFQQLKGKHGAGL